MLARFAEQRGAPFWPCFGWSEGGRWRGGAAGPLGENFGLSCVSGVASLAPIARGNEAGINLLITALAIAYCRSRA